MYFFCFNSISNHRSQRFRRHASKALTSWGREGSTEAFMENLNMFRLIRIYNCCINIWIASCDITIRLHANRSNGRDWNWRINGMLTNLHPVYIWRESSENNTLLAFTFLGLSSGLQKSSPWTLQEFSLWVLQPTRWSSSWSRPQTGQRW